MRARALAPNRRNHRGALLVALALLGCNLENPGDEPPRATLYFPNAIALSPAEGGAPARYLFVANSNFDLRYKAGSVLALSLDRLQQRIARCAGDDCTIRTADVVEDEVWIGSFATALAYSASPVAAGQDFLFVTTRTDENLTFIRVDPDSDGDRVLRCVGDALDCDLTATRSVDPSTGEGELDWPTEPVALISGAMSDWSSLADPDQRYVLVAHRAGRVSLLLEDLGAGVDERERFTLGAVLGGFPLGLTNVGFDPSTRLAHLTGGVRIARVGVSADADGAVLYNASPLQLDAAPGQPDTRDVVFIPGLPDAGEALSADSALVVSDPPSALLLVDVDETRNPPNSARVKRSAAVGLGASRVAAGLIGGRPTAVVACFTARALFVVDLATMLTRSVVPNLSGPFDIALDEARQLVYVTDFRSSVVRVVDLSRLAASEDQASARVIATIGEPRVLQELR